MWFMRKNKNIAANTIPDHVVDIFYIFIYVYLWQKQLSGGMEIIKNKKKPVFVYTVGVG